MAKKMDFGVYTEIQVNQGDNYKRRLDETMMLGRRADELGYDVFMALEHHFFQTFSTSSNPLALFSALSQVTDSIVFRAMCHTLPIHNPMVLAEEIAMADLICDGRLQAGVGRGHGWLHWFCGLDPADSVVKYRETIEILHKAWTEDSFSYDGEFYQIPEVSAVPKPLQEGGPRIYLTGTSGKSFEMAGEKGWGIVVGGPAPADIFLDAVHKYLDACEKFGNEPDIGYVTCCYLAEDEKQARKEAEADMLQSYRNLAVPQSTIKTDAQREQLNAAGYQFYASGALSAFDTITYDEVIDSKLAFVGTPDGFLERIEEIKKMFDFNELSLMADFAGLKPWQVNRTIELFADHCMPELS